VGSNLQNTSLLLVRQLLSASRSRQNRLRLHFVSNSTRFPSLVCRKFLLSFLLLLASRSQAYFVFSFFSSFCFVAPFDACTSLIVLCLESDSHSYPSPFSFAFSCLCENTNISSNSTWLDSTRLDTFDVSSPCILAVSS